jgi:NTE family protein
MALSDGRIPTVVVPGGAALGGLRVRALEALHEQPPELEPLAVAGISTGAVTAAVVGGARGGAPSTP